jgi:hypothetical protein
MCPGLFNALSGIGGGGQVGTDYTLLLCLSHPSQLDATTGANANVALNATFSVCAFLAGSINNKLGARLTLQLGSLGYGLYIAGFLYDFVRAIFLLLIPVHQSAEYSSRRKGVYDHRRGHFGRLRRPIMDGPRVTYVGISGMRGVPLSMLLTQYPTRRSPKKANS